ncbi:MAG: folate-binding protein [Gammaproteobacteria bacterium]|nr:folate-binding protein [Gammaproteobacteria bacterium]
MNNEWEKFLLSNNAQLDNNRVKSFGHSIGKEQNAYSGLIIADLSYYALIEASGDDVVEFLQGQLTNDIKLVTDELGQLSAYCSPKGRILASFRIFMRDGHYFLKLHSDILEATLKRLRMFVMRSKVELTDSSDKFARIGIAGTNSSNKLTTIFTALPENTDESLTEDEMTIIKLPGTLPCYEVHGPVEKVKVLWQKLQNDAVAVGENSWNLLTIRAGIPEIVAETVEAFVPQMVNLQAINSLSFTKGCYPGQEVVARMHYLGKLKRRLFIGSVETDTLPIPGQSILTESENEEKAGQIVSASWSNDKSVEILAVLQIEKAENEVLHIGSNDDSTIHTIQLIDLPYSLDQDEKKANKT